MTDILYVCDRAACETCNPDVCCLTSDIAHAKSFVKPQGSPAYIEASYFDDAPKPYFRQCVICNYQYDNKPAIFHKWVDSSVTKKDGSTIVQTLALVELEDGVVLQVATKSLKFLDSEDYFSKSFEEQEEKTTFRRVTKDDGR